MAQRNALTLYASGIGVFEREYDLTQNGDKPLEVNIPLKRDALATVLQTFSYDGCRMAVAPSFASSEEASAFQVDGTNVLRSFADSLKGAAIAVTRQGGQPISGKLVGYESLEQDRGTYKSQEFWLVILNEQNQFTRIRFNDIQSWDFSEARIRNEIEKALRYSLEQTKPNSTTLTFALAQKGDNQYGRVRFGVPLSSPKPTFRIRRVKGSFFFDLCAVINNPTDERWEGVEVTVITGQPIALDVADIAVPTMPQRQRVNLIPDNQQGVVQPKTGTKGGPVGGTRAARTMQAAPQMAAAMAELESTYAPAGASVPAEPQEFNTTLSDVGDFAIFTCSEPQTIEPGKASLITLYSTVLPKAELVLYYQWSAKKGANNERGFRTIKAVNTMPYSLQRGNYAVYEAGEKDETRLTLMGENLLDSVGINETLMVPHAVETGVLFAREAKDVTSRVSRLNISDGVVQQETTRTCVTYYRISNNKDTEFVVVIDHNWRIEGSTPSSDAELVETLKDGFRYSCKVRGNSQAVVTVKETKVDSDRIELGNFAWVKKTIIDAKHPLVTDARIREIIGLQEAIDKTEREIATLQSNMQALEQRNATIRSNLAAGGHGTDVDTWKTTLAKNDNRVNTIATEEIPALNSKKQEQVDLLRTGLKKLSLSYESSSTDTSGNGESPQVRRATANSV